MDDIIIPEEKKGMMEAANKEVSSIMQQYHKGVITQEERYNRVIEVWQKANDELTSVMMKTLTGKSRLQEYGFCLAENLLFLMQLFP